MAVGVVVGHECIVSASRMNNAKVIFLNSIEKANELVEHGIVIGGELVMCFLSYSHQRESLYPMFPHFLVMRY